MNTKTSIEISRKYRESGKHRPLFETDGWQPLKAFLDLDEEGWVTIGPDEEYGAIPEPVWHNRWIRFGVNNELTIEEIDQLLEEITPLLEAVHAGHWVEWNGSNHVGQLTEEAQQAKEAIECKIDACWPREPVDWDVDCPADS